MNVNFELSNNQAKVLALYQGPNIIKLKVNSPLDSQRRLLTCHTIYEECYNLCEGPYY